MRDALDDATFDYTDEEFQKDIEVILNVNPDEIVVDDDEKDNNSKKGFGEFISNIGKKKDEVKESVSNITTPVDPYEELKKLKELLDMGIITQEEFDQKKKQLLNL